MYKVFIASEYFHVLVRSNYKVQYILLWFYIINQDKAVDAYFTAIHCFIEK